MPSVTYLKDALTDLAEAETIGLCKGFTFTETGGMTVTGEPEGDGYARQVIPVEAWTEPARRGTRQVAFTETAAIVTFPVATGPWGTLRYAVIRRQSDGRIVDVVALQDPVTVRAGDQVRIPAGGYRREVS